MERESGQIRVDNTHFYQHQFFPGGGGKQLPHPSGRSQSIDRERPEPHWLAGANWSRTVPQNGERPTHAEGWNTKSWEWDSNSFTAQRGNGAAEGSGVEGFRSNKRHENGNHRKDADLGLKLDSRGSGTPEAEHQVIHIDDDDDEDETELQSQTFFGRETPSPPSNEANPYTRGDDSPDDDCPLSLNLGGNLYAYPEENGSRNAKRGRSSSPPSQLPTCQVDNCSADLGKAKDYHRRHKVCEMHSKAAKALVNNEMQRFCQQCSRFHSLDSFDEGKRSCRRRLAGHNRRRRKPQPEAAAARSWIGGDEANGNNPEILNILSILHQLQGPPERVNAATSDQDILLQCLRQAGSVPTSTLEVLNRAVPSWSHLTRNPDHVMPRTEPSLPVPQLNGHSSVSTPSPEAYSILLQNSLKEAARIAQENLVSLVGENGFSGPLPYALSGAEVSTTQPGPSQRYDERTSPAPGFPSSGPMSGIPSSTIEPVQLLANVARTMQQIIAPQAGRQGNHTLGSGHATPQPVVQRALPPHSSAEMRDTVNRSLDRNEEEDTSHSVRVDRQGQPMQKRSKNSRNKLFSEAQSPLCRPSTDSQKHRSQQPSDTSQSGSGSDQISAGTSIAEWENRNSRISFKLFDKHPGQFPEALRSQIEEWLSHRPSDMESFIRPGCIILTVFLSMPESAWAELVSDLPGSLKRLLDICEGNFWCTGRILVQVDRQSVFIIDGEIIGSRVADPLSSPYIQSVRPLAIVAGQQTSMVVEGFNLMKVGTRLLCSYRGKYIAEELYKQDETDDESVASGGDSDVEEDTAGDSVLSRSLSGIEEGKLGRTLVGGDTFFTENDKAAAVGSVAALDGVVDQPVASFDSSIEDEMVGCQADVHGELSVGPHQLVDLRTSLHRTRAVVQLDGSFFISERMASNVGRCFIEVDQNTLEGNWKPVIVADGPVCAEIRTLEDEIEAAATIACKAAEQKGLQRSVVLYCTELARLVEEEEVTRFLHELGWFFQRSFIEHFSGPSHAAPVSSMRLKQLLVFSVERNWCAVVRKMLDVAFENQDLGAAFSELSDVLQEEVSLLHRAVRKKCRPMVELLLAYVPSFLAGINVADMKSFKRKMEFKVKWGTIFKPDMRGPAGLTPLHIAASMRDAEEVVDALTSDPCQVGLHAWLNKQDDSGETPLSCALEGGNMKSVQLVRAKLVRAENPDSTSVSITTDRLWDQHLRRESIVQLELPVGRPSLTAGVLGLPGALVWHTCRDQDFARLPPHVGGFRGAIYRPFLA